MSLKLFRLTMGSIEKHGVAADQEEMFAKRAELDPSFEYTPVVVEEVRVPGYEINVYPEGTALNGIRTEPPAEQQEESEVLELPFDVENATKAELTAFLEGKGVDVKSRMTVADLQALVIQHV